MDIEYLDYKSFELQRVGTGNEFPLWGMRPSTQTSRPELGLEGLWNERPSRSGRQHQHAPDRV